MEKKEKYRDLRQLPSIEKLLNAPEILPLVELHGRPVATYSARRAIRKIRERIGAQTGPPEFSFEEAVRETKRRLESIAEPSLRPVINATGVVLHTNLGRAPLGESVLREIAPLIRGYSNLEFDLGRAERGHRGDHIAELVRYLTGAEDAVVVNNNAAAIILALHTLANGREAIISRGELIEIGGSFRIPDIMAAAGARMVEVGTTNRTRLSDYEKAIGPDTALIVKAHRSNFTMSGFTEEVSIRDLAGLGRKNGLPFLYDIGSGLLRRPAIGQLQNEPDVCGALEDGADLVAFSCDKLLGGPQAGIVAGTSDLVKRLAGAPMMRALRVGKLTLAALASTCRYYIDDRKLAAGNPVVSLLERSDAERERLAGMLHAELAKRGVLARTVESFGQCGGGTLPDLKMPSVAVALIADPKHGERSDGFAQRVFHSLLRGERPVLAVLREGILLFDVFALFEDEIETVASRAAECVRSARNV